MTGWLRLLGVAVMALGFAAAGYTGTLALTDADFAKAKDAYERHEDHPLFKADYYAAAGRHWALVAGAVASGLGGLVFGSILLGLGGISARLPKPD
ncbi:MAG TPA: hypothetical protein VMS22_00510 [Candidatus Eisenbacteria bacterium]|nr:hypothetical protein [Candidatus Eisenbacteria bacterium]